MNRKLKIWERVAEVPWIAYFLGCALLCLAGMLVFAGSLVLWRGCAKLAAWICDHSTSDRVRLSVRSGRCSGT